MARSRCVNVEETNSFKRHVIEDEDDDDYDNVDDDYDNGDGGNDYGDDDGDNYDYYYDDEDE